jgi:tetraacyldisaccharide 4'-kinase
LQKNKVTLVLFYNQFHYKKLMLKGLDLLFFLGRPFGPLYSVAMKTREKLYTSAVFRQQSLSVPVISIGNLMLGGTGKTPTVQHIAKLLLKQGYHPAIISRGYGGKAKEAVNVVSDGKSVFLSPELAGDEPHMLARSLPGIPVLTGIRRIIPCRYSIDNLQCDVIILDDGFQHIAVKRDIDIVLFDSATLAGNSRVFPGGPLREPSSALNRCHAFLLTGENATNQERAKKFSHLLQQRFTNRPVFISSLESYKLVGQNDTIAEESESKKIFGFCGIANPSRFEKSLIQLGVKLAAFQALKDHVSYNQTLVSRLCKKADECGAEWLVTTEKDYVKLQNFNFDLPLYVLQVQHKVDELFDLFLLDSLKLLQKLPLSPNQ